MPSTPSNITHEIRFHYYSLQFKALKNVNENSNDILIRVITYITQELFNKKGYIIDRYRNRASSERREVFISYAAINHKEKRIKCSMALLRSGKEPLLKPADSFELIPLSKTSGSIAEQTHFFIDFNRPKAVICLEYNYNGPRISDIEFYFRSIAHDRLRLSKATDITLYMDDTIDRTLKSLANVLNFEFKFQPEKVAKMDEKIKGYISGMSGMANRIKPRFMKVEALFQTPGKVKSKELNKEGTNMIKSILGACIKEPHNIELFENFEVKYEDKDGEEEVFNLLRSKTVTVKEIDFNKVKKTTDWYEEIKNDFDDFITSL